MLRNMSNLQSVIETKSVLTLSGVHSRGIDFSRITVVHDFCDFFFSFSTLI